MSSVQQPSVGRIVHYVLPTGTYHAGEHRPAIITQVWQDMSSESAPGLSNLSVFKGQAGDLHRDDFRIDGKPVPFGAVMLDGPVALVGSIAYSEEPKPNTWHWPERV